MSNIDFSQVKAISLGNKTIAKITETSTGKVLWQAPNITFKPDGTIDVINEINYETFDDLL